MDSDARRWTEAGLDAAARKALDEGLAPSALWSLLLGVVERRAGRKSASALLQQWRQDRFVRPCEVDQRTLNELDAHLLAAAAQFEAVELAPLAPLGACSSVALTSQNRIVSTTRGTEVISDPTNVLALESARRLRENPSAEVKLATSHRCVRAQEVPDLPGFAAHFRIFCLTSAAHERKDQAFLTDALAEHIRTWLGALERLERHAYAFPDRKVRVLATSERRHLAERIAATLSGVPVSIVHLTHGYYDGLRFQIDAGTTDGTGIPLIDGGAFDWLHKLGANDKLSFVGSGMGSQIAAFLFRRPG
jgi:hypothetical protein